jgi:hypothetical protein
MRQWQVLRQLTAGRKTTSELAEILARRSDSVARGLRTLEERGLVELEDEVPHTRPGQPGGWWALTAAGQELVDAAPVPPEVATVDSGRAPYGTTDAVDSDDEEETAPSSWPIERYQSFVAATVESSRVPELLEVLAAGQQAVESTFVARLDGDSHDYLFIFDRRLGSRPAEALGSALGAANLKFNLGVVGDVRSVDGLVRDARAAGVAAQAVINARTRPSEN